MRGRLQVIHLKTLPVYIKADKIIEFLNKCVAAIEMKPHGDIRLIKYDPPFDNPALFSFLAFQPLKESYIAIDTWSELEYLNIVINSCKNFNVNKAIGVAIKTFNPYLVWCGSSEIYTGEPKTKTVLYRRKRWLVYLKTFFKNLIMGDIITKQPKTS